MGAPHNDAPSRRTEVIAGLTTFFTMSYAVVVIPGMLATEGTGLPFSGGLTATVLVALLSTAAMGLVARLPYAVAPGVGIAAFLTFSVILGQGVPGPTALGLVFLAGIVFLAISATGLREAIANAVPPAVRTGAAAGIGLFLAFIGLQKAGVVVPHPTTLVTFGPLDARVGLFALGTVTAAALLRRGSSIAFLAPIAGITVLGVAFGLADAPASWTSPPDPSLFLALDLRAALDPALLGVLAALVLTDLLDSLSTFVGVAAAAGLEDADGKPLNLRQGLLVDAFATTIAGVLGTASGTAYIESAAGVEAGGRGRLTALTCALCFAPCLFLAPVFAAVPAFATAPVLVLVGALMFRTVSRSDLNRIEDVVPLYLTTILIPLTFSITHGILWGFGAHVVLYVVVGRHRELHPVTLVIALAGIALLVGG